MSAERTVNICQDYDKINAEKQYKGLYFMNELRLVTEDEFGFQILYSSSERWMRLRDIALYIFP